MINFIHYYCFWCMMGKRVNVSTWAKDACNRHLIEHLHMFGDEYLLEIEKRIFHD